MKLENRTESDVTLQPLNKHITVEVDNTPVPDPVGDREHELDLRVV